MLFRNVQFHEDDSMYLVRIQQAGVQPKSVVVDSSRNYEFFGGSLNVKDGLVKRVSGNLYLNITQPLETGRTTLHDGTLMLGNDRALGYELAIHGGTVSTTGNRTLPSRVFFESTSATFYGPGTFTFPRARLNAGATTINILGPRLTFNQGIYQGNASALIKDGRGELMLASTHSFPSSSSSYSGGTTMKRGRLLVNGDPNGGASQTGTGAVSVESGAKLAGRGNIAGDVKVNASATLEPNDVLAMNSLMLAPNASYVVSLNAGGAAPQDTYTVVRSGAQLGDSRLDIRLNYEPSVGDRFIILEGDATGEFAGQDGKPLLPTKPINVTSPSGRRVTMQIKYVGDVVLTVVPDNRPPQLFWPGQADPNAQILELTVDAGDTLQVIASASDPDELNFLRSPEVSYMGDNLGDPKPALSPPQYLPDLSVRKTFTWTPIKAQAPKTYIFKFKATDPEGLVDEKTLKVTVNLPNAAPHLGLEREGRLLLEPAEFNLEVDEGKTLQIRITGFDEDQPPDDLNFSLEGQPAGMTIKLDAAAPNSRVRIIEWTPGEEDGGKEFTVKVKVTDRPNVDPKLKAAEQTFKVKVNEVNSLPFATSEAVGAVPTLEPVAPSLRLNATG